MKTISYVPITGFFRRYELYKGTTTSTKLMHHMVGLTKLNNHIGVIYFKENRFCLQVY